MYVVKIVKYKHIKTCEKRNNNTCIKYDIY